MGAYENPQMIQTANYGEIFARNAQNLITISQEKKKEKEARFLAAAENTTDYAKRASNIKAGALTENINNIGLGLGDAFALNERLFAQKKISAEEYYNNKAKYEMTLNTLSVAGSTIRQFGEDIKNLDLSLYQESPALIGLIDAYQKGSVDAEIVDGKVELHYMSEDGQRVEVDESWLTNQDSWNVVEKFKNDQFTTDLANVYKDKLTQEVSTKIINEDGSITTAEQRYAEGYGTREDRMDKILQNPLISGLTDQQLASYYMDKVSSNINTDDEDVKYVLDKLPEERRKQAEEALKSKKWSNEFSNEFKEVAKRKIAAETEAKMPLPKSKISSEIDKTPKTDKFATAIELGNNLANDLANDIPGFLKNIGIQNPVLDKTSGKLTYTEYIEDENGVSQPRQVVLDINNRSDIRTIATNVFNAQYSPNDISGQDRQEALNAFLNTFTSKLQDIKVNEPTTTTTTKPDQTINPRETFKDTDPKILDGLEELGLEINEKNIDYLKDQLGNIQGSIRQGIETLKKRKEDKLKKENTVPGKFKDRSGTVVSFNMDDTSAKATRLTPLQKSFFEKNNIPKTYDNLKVFNDYYEKRGNINTLRAFDKREEFEQYKK